MLAVVEIGGNQFMVQKGDIIDVKKQTTDEKKKMSVEALLLSDVDGKDVKVGTPMVAGSKVELKILEHYKGEKVRVFKMKSKKRYSRNKGFRPHMTKLEVVSIA